MNRENNFDLMRIILAFMVVLLHVSASFWGEKMDLSIDTISIVSLNLLVRSTVPLFFMISGYFLIGKNISIKKQIQMTLKMFFIYVFFTFFYAFTDIRENFSLKEFVSLLIAGKYHLWFLKNLTWAYLFLPLLSSIVFYKEGKFLPYMLLIFFIFGILKYNIHGILNLYGNSTLTNLFEKFSLYSLTDTTYYLLLGYYLGNLKVKCKKWILIFVFFVLVILNIALGIYSVKLYGEVKTLLYDNFFILIFLESIVLFLFFKNLEIRYNFRKFSELTFGIYLFHPLVLGFLNLNFLMLPIFIKILVLTILTFVITSILVYVIRFIQPVRKLI